MNAMNVCERDGTSLVCHVPGPWVQHKLIDPLLLHVWPAQADEADGGLAAESVTRSLPSR